MCACFGGKIRKKSNGKSASAKKPAQSFPLHGVQEKK
jgi:hypothetical protein